MSDATCKTCSWHGAIHHYKGSRWVGSEPGCRRNPPPFQPIDPDKDWCGEHPERGLFEIARECVTTTLVGRETFPTESDMRCIVDALEKMASRAVKS